MLELKNVSFEVPDKEIIKDVSMTLDDKSFLVITGPNGGGKSTLAKIIAGIEKPSSGQIILDGVDITNMTITERAKEGIGFAFQHPVRFKGITVRDLISLAAGTKLSVGEVCGYLGEVGLCARDYVFREIDSKLSGGELKRIEIASIIAKGSKLSLFDEPEAGIDLWSFHNLIRVFEKLRDTRDASIIIISHQERLFDIADKVAVVDSGVVTKFGDKDKILPELLNSVNAHCKYYTEGDN